MRRIELVNQLTGVIVVTVLSLTLIVAAFRSDSQAESGGHSDHEDVHEAASLHPMSTVPVSLSPAAQ